MSRSGPRTARAALLLIAAAVVSGCTSQTAKTLVAGSPLTGEWYATSSVVSTTCDAETARLLIPIRAPYFIDQADESFLIRAEGCCVRFPWSTGSVEGLDITYQMERRYDPSAGCSLHIQESGSGRLAGSGIRGEATLAVTASGDCGPGFPCEIRGDLALARCTESCAPVCPAILCIPEG